MSTRKRWLAFFLTFLLIGCESKGIQKNFSGFISDYSEMTQEENTSTSQMLQWVSPLYSASHYDKIIREPVVYYPAPTSSYLVEQKKLQEILRYADQKIAAALACMKNRDGFENGNTLIFKGAVTRIDEEVQGIQSDEMIPIGWVIVPTQIASKHRKMQTSLHFEGQFIDAKTGEAVIKFVRKEIANPLENAQEPIVLETMKPAIDRISTAVGLFLRQQQ